MITATEAQKLANNFFEEKMQKLGDIIEIAAKTGKRTLRCGVENPELWQYGNVMEDGWNEMVEYLGRYGYNTFFDENKNSTIIK